MAERNPERTRRRLIDAASAVVAERGFHGASVDLIAERAGLSIGALYGNFGGKDAVLFAVFQEHVTWLEDGLDALSEADDLAAAIAAWFEGLAREPEQFLIFVEFWSYAVRRPELRRDLAGHLARMRERAEAALARRDAGPTPLPPALAAQLALAIGRGLAFEKLTDPDSVPDREVAGLLATLLGDGAPR